MVKRITAIVSAALCVGLIVTFVPSLATIEKAFANVRAPSMYNSAVNPPLLQRSCDDFEFAFLNPTCSKAHTKRAVRIKHRVATFVAGKSGSDQLAAKR
jgi:hypothetical protein